ncbi:MAG: hypothetical protein FDZ75_08045 [Actinobacteria bacterium]|nr:MAG: hypothetical protein FDZ75_08045 [Actinomycetota bacterium]
MPSDFTSGYVGIIRSDGLVSNGVWGSIVPRLDGVSDWWAAPGSVIRVTGAGFGSEQGPKIVYLAGSPMEVVSWSDSVIEARVPSGAKSGYVGVGTDSVCSAGRYLLVETPGRVSRITPAWGLPGDRLVVEGTGFGELLATSKVTISGLECSIQSWSDTRVSVLVPAGVRSGYVGVSKNGVSSNGVWFTSFAPVAQ